jgi:hypothetical protein
MGGHLAHGVFGRLDFRRPKRRGRVCFMPVFVTRFPGTSQRAGPLLPERGQNWGRRQTWERGQNPDPEQNW